MADTVDVEELTARLYVTAPETFVATRAEGSRQLKAAGQTDAARDFAKLVKPSLPAWVVNLLVAERPDVIDDVIARGNSLRRAHTGGSAASDIRAAQQARQEAIRVATDTAAELAGRPLSEAHRDDIAATLEAVASDATAADEVRAGRLVRPLAAPTGFDVLGGLTVIAGGRTGARNAGRGAGDRGDAEADEQARAARATMLRADADTALSDAESAAGAVSELGQQMAALEKERERAAAELARLDEQISTVRSDLRTAERAATDAARKAVRAATRAERADT